MGSNKILNGRPKAPPKAQHIYPVGIDRARLMVMIRTNTNDAYSAIRFVQLLLLVNCYHIQRRSLLLLYRMIAAVFSCEMSPWLWLIRYGWCQCRPQPVKSLYHLKLYTPILCWPNTVLAQYCAGPILCWPNTVLAQYCAGPILCWPNTVLVLKFWSSCVATKKAQLWCIWF